MTIEQLYSGDMASRWQAITVYDVGNVCARQVIARIKREGLPEGFPCIWLKVAL